MPRGPKKRKTGKGKTATSKKIIIEHAAEANCSKSLGIHGGAILHSRQFDFKWDPGPFLPLLIAKFWSRYNTSISTPNQSSSPLWIAASTPDTVPAIPVSARKTLTTAPPKFVQRLITARAKLVKQRWFSVQDFCVGLADPSVRELLSSGAKL